MILGNIGAIISLVEDLAAIASTIVSGSWPTPEELTSLSKDVESLVGALKK